MKIYTLDIDIKDKLLSNGQSLITERENKGENIYIFNINNISILNYFSKEEKERIFIINNIMNI
ncbi:hypothetical protein [Clostridium sp.]|uniref:hypothetical protein n=1 Tax=Clostridium sp. TaxID=1506 RepID=UPI002FC70A7F